MATTACGGPGSSPSPTAPAKAEPTALAALPTISRTPEPTRTPVPTASPTQAPATATPTPQVLTAKEVGDLLGSAETSYAGSIAARAHNVELATERLDGTAIAPGDVFSFNRALGGASIAKGFKIGYGITMKDGQAETIESVAGGICQVSTTLFQAAYWAGLPIVERYYHLYWISKYGKPPKGALGFDATVDEPSLDFKFRNTTDHFLRIDSWVKGQSIGFRIMGVEPGWEVFSSKPNVTNVIPKKTEIVRQEDPSMSPGQELWVETAEDGFTVEVTRTVKDKAGKQIDEYTFRHRYLPARNVILVGTKGATPTPAATPTAEPTLEPTAAPPTATSAPAKPAPTPPPAGRTASGNIIVPNVVGLPEAQGKAAIAQAGLANSYTNYQGKDQLPDAVRNRVPVGTILSQTPAGGAEVKPGTTVLVAVRKD